MSVMICVYRKPSPGRRTYFYGFGKSGRRVLEGQKRKFKTLASLLRAADRTMT